MAEINIKRIIAPEDFKAHFNEKITDEQYHLQDEFVGSSSAKLMLPENSPAAFFAYFFLGHRMPETPEQIIGKRVHMALLEPDLFKRKLVVMPTFGDGNMRRKINQIERDEWILDKPKGSVTVTNEELDQIIGIAEAIRKHDQGIALLKDGRTELAGYARCPISGLALKLKTDFLSFDLTRFSDYKTTKSTIKKDFMRDVFKTWRYDFQLAFYLYVLKLITGKRPSLITILASEKKPPYEPAAFYFTEFELQRAEAQVIDCLVRLRKCIDDNIWPFRQQEIERAEMPKFLQDEEYDEASGVYNAFK